jgi:hypothetical protein
MSPAYTEYTLDQPKFSELGSNFFLDRKDICSLIIIYSFFFKKKFPWSCQRWFCVKFLAFLVRRILSIQLAYTQWSSATVQRILSVFQPLFSVYSVKIDTGSAYTQCNSGPVQRTLSVKKKFAIQFQWRLAYTQCKLGLGSAYTQYKVTHVQRILSIKQHMFSVYSV